jgi:uncharacterized protein (DUF2062 family)
MAAMIIGSVCAVLAGIAVAVLARHERRQRETWRDSRRARPYRTPDHQA